MCSVVTPFNAQVREIDHALARAGIAGVRVGTVDKFQGQEAPAVVYSMASSSAGGRPAWAGVPLRSAPAERGHFTCAGGGGDRRESRSAAGVLPDAAADGAGQCALPGSVSSTPRVLGDNWFVAYFRLAVTPKA